MDVVLSVDGALVSKIGLTNSSGATTTGQADAAELLFALLLFTIDPPKGLVLLPSGLGGMLVALKIGHRL